MLLRQIKYFIAIVEKGNFTEAAYSCGISQSAISQQIQTLEKDLGVQLLERKGRSFALTPAGDYFYSHARSLAGQADELVRETRRLGDDNELRLRIGYPISYGADELYKTVAWFSQVYPEVSISISRGNHEALYDMLRFSEADIILNDQRRAFSEEYENYELLTCPMCIEIAENNQLSCKEEIEINELRSLPCILVSSKDQQEKEQEYFSSTLGFGESFLFAGSLDEARLMAVSNNGYMPIDIAGRIQPSGSALRRIPVIRNNTPVTVKYCLFWKKLNSNYYIEEFADAFKRQM